VKRPSAVNVIGRRVRLVWKNEAAMPEQDGTWHAGKSRIDIRRGQQPIDEVDAVLHELMHAVLSHQGREDGGKVEEMYVRALATGTLTVLRSNPELTAWLLREIAE
jgi:hypothetical protein